MQQSFPFQPTGASSDPPTASTQIAVTAAVQQLTLPADGFDGGSMRLINAGTATIAWSYGVAAGLTTANGVVMLPNTVETFSLPGGISQLSVIGAATGSTLTATIGQGI